MNIIATIRKKVESKRKQKVIDSLRREFARWGFSLDDLSDEQIEEGVVEASKAVAKAGVTAEEAAEWLKILHSLP